MVLGATLFLGAAPASAWRREIPTGTANAVSLHPSGDVIAAGFISDEFGVVRVAAADGAEVWRYQIDGTEPGDIDARVPWRSTATATSSPRARFAPWGAGISRW